MDVATPRTTASATDGQRALESFGYKQELHRSVATVDLVV
jgi:hypothetical protein